MKSEIKIFLIKLISIVFAIILIINTTYNLIFAEKIESLTKILSFKENKLEIRNKIRSELSKALDKEQILHLPCPRYFLRALLREVAAYLVPPPSP